MSPLAPWSAIIFDMDGVLLDTEPLYTQATQQVVDEFGKVFDWSIKGDMIGRGALDGAQYLVKALDLPIAPEEYLRRRKPILEALFHHAQEMPGARRVVTALKERGIPLALATSSDHAQFLIKSGHHDWFDRFDVIVCGDDPRVGSPKPAPDIFLVAAEELSQPNDVCLVFEDSLAGVTAARRAGMQVVAMPDPAMDKSRYTEAHRVIESLQTLDLDSL